MVAPLVPPLVGVGVVGAAGATLLSPSAPSRTEDPGASPQEDPKAQEGGVESGSAAEAVASGASGADKKKAAAEAEGLTAGDSGEGAGVVAAAAQQGSIERGS
mmetsp:Transcript_26301/g.59657  ORF Transcript_26301/g.59657 Transcript_26301/m.59657 type:complete len:103 (-) Transcript_26301:635-943(-)